jgi:hypothetical protein
MMRMRLNSFSTMDTLSLTVTHIRIKRLNSLELKRDTLHLSETIKAISLNTLENTLNWSTYSEEL